MLSFLNDSNIKQQYLNQVLSHQNNNEIVQGSYWDGEKGCAVGVTIHSADHSLYESLLGIPKWLAYAEDKIGEGLTLNDAKSWPYDFLNSIPVGVDLDQIKVSFLISIIESAQLQFDNIFYPKQALYISDTLSELNENNIDVKVLRKNRHDNDVYAYADAAAYAGFAAANICGDALAFSDAGIAMALGFAIDAAGFKSATISNAKTTAYSNFRDNLVSLLSASVNPTPSIPTIIKT